MKYFGLLPFLMNEFGGEGGGGGAVTTTSTDTPSSPGTDLVPAGNSAITGPDTSYQDEGTGTDLTAHEESGAAPSNFRAVERGRPTESTSAALKLLKAEHPEHAALTAYIPRALARDSKLASMFPGQNPFKAIEAMQKELKALGGAKGIAEIRTELADVEENDLLYANGDPKLLAKMTATPAAKAAFMKMVPHAFRLFESLAPNAYTAYMAKTFVGHMMGQDFDLHMRRLASMIPAENADAVSELTQVQKFISDLQGMTKLQPEDLDVKPPATAANDTERAERLELQRENWRTARDADMNRIYTEEWGKQAEGRTITPRQKLNIESQFKTRLNAGRRSISDYRNTIDGFEASRDRNGFLQLHRDYFTQNIGRMLAHEIREELGAAPAKRPAASDTTATGARPAVAVAPTPGWRKVAASPEYEAMKRGPGGTTLEMMKEHKAILKDGTKVTW